MVVDDHVMIRAGIKVLIDAQPDMRVVAEAGTIAEALRQAEDCAPEIILLDISLQGQSGLRAIERFKKVCPRARVLVLTMHDEKTYLHVALAAGCSGYIVKSAADTDLILAIRTVRAGRPFILLTGNGEADQPTEGLAGSLSHRNQSESLSAREREVLHHLALGYTNQECADQLFLSVKTVETYRHRLGCKLGLHTRAELVRYGIEMGLFAASGEMVDKPAD
jgi:two-component system, NarL family, response regulator NreC